MLKFILEQVGGVGIASCGGGASLVWYRWCGMISCGMVGMVCLVWLVWCGIIEVWYGMVGVVWYGVVGGAS